MSPQERHADERPPRVCGVCGGDGGGLEVYATPGTLDGTRTEAWICRACGGSGWIEDDSVLIEEEDLASMAEDGPCTMGVGCDEAGICYAQAQGQPERCPRQSHRGHPA